MLEPIDKAARIALEHTISEPGRESSEVLLQAFAAYLAAASALAEGLARHDDLNTDEQAWFRAQVLPLLHYGEAHWFGSEVSRDKMLGDLHSMVMELEAMVEEGE